MIENILNEIRNTMRDLFNGGRIRIYKTTFYTLTLSIVLFIVYCFITGLTSKVLDLFGYNKSRFETRFGSSDFSIYFNTSKYETLEFLNLHAIQFWSATNLIFEENSEIEIAASGLVSLNKDYKDNVDRTVDSLIKEGNAITNTNKNGNLQAKFLNEFERYTRGKWFAPDGDSIVYFKSSEINTIDSCRDLLFKRSEENRLVRGDVSKGTLVGFLISNEKMKELNPPYKKSNNLDSLIDTLLVDYVRKSKQNNNKESQDIFAFPVKGRCKLVKRSFEEYKPKSKDDYTVYVPEKFYYSKIYLMVNDAIILDDKEFSLKEIEECKQSPQEQYKIRTIHEKYYYNYSRKPGFWFLDNAGSYNIILKSKTNH